MSEAMKRTPEIPISRGERELLADRIETKQRFAETFGVDMHYLIRDLNDTLRPVIAESDPDAPTFAASVNKLLVARAIIADASEEDTGIADMLRRMLQDSDNEATAALIGYAGAESINSLAVAASLENTGLHIRSNGTSHLGTTTPREALAMLLALVEIPADASELAQTAREALADSRSKYGVRPKLAVSEGQVLFNKSGQINHDQELREQFGREVFHHDAGVIVNGPRRIGYAIMTEGSARTKPGKRLQAWIADTMIGQLGARMVEATEFESRSPHTVRNGMAQAAIKSSIRQP